MEERSITDLRAERTQKIAAARALVEAAKKESRKMTAEEETQYNGIQLDCRELDLQVLEAEQRNRAEVQKKETAKPFSLRRAILETSEGAQSDETRAVSNRGRELMRDCALGASGNLFIPVQSRAALNATGTPLTNGGNTIETDRAEIMMPLMSELITAKLGCRSMTGLVGNIEFPSYSGSSAFWKGENIAATDGAGTFDDPVTFSPKRLTAKVLISKQLLIQSSEDVEGIIRQTLVDAVRDKLEATIFGSEAGSATQPAGLFATAPTDKGALTWARLVGMETTLAEANALRGNLEYVMHPALFGKCKTELKAPAVAGFLVDGKMANGYGVSQTTNIAKGLQTAKDEYGIVFANWADFFIGQWGAIDLTVDNVTNAETAQVKLVINAWFDFGMLRPESFAIASGK